MKCSKCQQVIADSKGIVLTFVGGYTYTAVLHRWCCDATIGPANTRKLVQLALDSGWVQHELPGFSLGNSPEGPVRGPWGVNKWPEKNPS